MALKAPVDWKCISPKAGTTIVEKTADEIKLVFPQTMTPDDAARIAKLLAILFAIAAYSDYLRFHAVTVGLVWWLLACGMNVGLSVAERTRQ